MHEAPERRGTVGHLLRRRFARGKGALENMPRMFDRVRTIQADLGLNQARDRPAKRTRIRRLRLAGIASPSGPIPEENSAMARLDLVEDRNRCGRMPRSAHRRL